MPRSADLAAVQRLVRGGAQLIEVLPAEEYADEHLPGAVNIPLKSLDGSRVAELDRGGQVIVYCWDGL